MNHDDVTGTLDTMIIGGGQAGLAMGYYLKEQKRKFLILDENPRTGDSWRQRWDSLRVFTPAKYDGLPAAPFPADPLSFPPKDELADYLERYAVEFELPVRQGTRVERLWREGDPLHRRLQRPPLGSEERGCGHRRGTCTQGPGIRFPARPFNCPAAFE